MFVVSRVYLLTLSSKNLVCLSRILFSESDYVVTVERKTSYSGVYCYCFTYFFVCFPQLVRLNIIMFMSLTILFVSLFHYFPITSNLLFFLLNITKASKQHTRVLQISFSRQVPGLSNRCTFALANGLSGIFISCY